MSLRRKCMGVFMVSAITVWSASPVWAAGDTTPSNRWTEVRLGAVGSPQEPILAIETADDVVVAATSRLVATSADGGVSWSSSVDVPDQFVVEAMALTNSEPATILLSGQELNVYQEQRAALRYRHLDALHWSKNHSFFVPVGPVADLVMAGRNAVVLAGEPRRQDIRSSFLPTVQTWYTRHALKDRRDLAAEQQDGLVFAVGAAGVERSSDFGQTWFEVSSQPLTQVAVSASNSDHVFGSLGSDLYFSFDTGFSWQPLTPAVGQRGLVTALIASTAGRVAYGTSTGQIFISLDAGDSWRQLAAGRLEQAITALAWRPLGDPQGTVERLWAGTDAGSVLVGTWRVEQLSSSALELRDGRFVASLEWRTASAEGVAASVPLSSDSGYFWFFEPSNVEVTVKVLDGRSVNGHFWVFYASQSDVEFTLTVRDQQSGAERTYVNTSGTLASAADLEAF